MMKSTGNYHAPVTWLLHDAEFYLCLRGQRDVGARLREQQFKACQDR